MAKSKWDIEHGTKYKNDYNKKNYDSYLLMLPKGKSLICNLPHNSISLINFKNKLLICYNF